MQQIDLTGEREFLTGETTRDALADMLKSGSKVSQVSVEAGTCYSSNKFIHF